MILLRVRRAMAFICSTGGRHVRYHLSTDTQLGLELKLTVEMFGLCASPTLLKPLSDR